MFHGKVSLGSFKVFETDQDFLTKKVSSTTCKNPSCPRNLDPKETQIKGCHTWMSHLQTSCDLTKQSFVWETFMHMCVHVPNQLQESHFFNDRGKVSKGSAGKPAMHAVCICWSWRWTIWQRCQKWFDRSLREVFGSVTNSPFSLTGCPELCCS